MIGSQSLKPDAVSVLDELAGAIELSPISGHFSQVQVEVSQRRMLGAGLIEQQGHSSVQRVLGVFESARFFIKAS